MSISIQINHRHLDDRTVRNNMQHFQETAQHFRRWLAGNPGKYTIFPTHPCSLPPGEVAEIEERRVGHLVIRTMPAGSGSAWSYTLRCPVGSNYSSIRQQIGDAMKQESRARIKQSLKAQAVSYTQPEPEPELELAKEAPMPTPQNGHVDHPPLATTGSLLDAMAEIITTAGRTKVFQDEIVDVRAKLAIKRSEYNKLADEVRKLEDRIAELELKIEADPDARRASLVLHNLAELMKGKS